MGLKSPGTCWERWALSVDRTDLAVAVDLRPKVITNCLCLVFYLLVITVSFPNSSSLPVPTEEGALSSLAWWETCYYLNVWVGINGSSYSPASLGSGSHLKVSLLAPLTFLLIISHYYQINLCPLLRLEWYCFVSGGS